MISEERAEKALQWKVDNAEAIAHAAGRRGYLEHKRKLVLAEEMSKHADKPLGVQERIAHCSDAYRAWLEEYEEALKVQEKWSVLVGASEDTIRLYQTSSANLRRV